MASASVTKSVAKAKSLDGASEKNGRAQKEVGNPYSKCVGYKFNVKTHAWCQAMNVVIDFVTKTVKKFTTTAGCRQAVKWFKNKKRWYKKGSTPKLGDQVYYDFKRKKPKYATHTGRIISVNTKKHTCVAEEGNVSNTTKKRCFNYLTYKYLLGFGRPFYK